MNDALARNDTNGNSLSLALSLVLHAMNHALYNMLTPLGLTLTSYFRFKSLTTITMGFSLYLGLYGFAQIPIGFLSDRVSRRNLLGAGAIVNGSAIALCAVFPNYHMFLVGMAIAGIGAAAFHPVNAAYVSDLYRKSRGSALGLSGFGATIGLFLGPVVGAALCEYVGWRKTFIVFAAAAVMSGITFILFAKEPDREIAPKQTGKIWNRGIVTFLAIAATIFTFREFAGWGGYFLMPVFSENYLGYSMKFAGLVGGTQTIAGFFAQPLGGFLSDKFGRRRLMSILLFFVSISMASIPFVGKTYLIPMVFMYGVFYTATVPIIDAMIADRIPSNIRGSVFGIFMASGIGISSFSQLTQAKILDASGYKFHGYVGCFMLLAGVAFMSMICMILFRGADKKQLI